MGGEEEEEENGWGWRVSNLDRDVSVCVCLIGYGGVFHLVSMEWRKGCAGDELPNFSRASFTSGTGLVGEWEATWKVWSISSLEERKRSR